MKKYWDLLDEMKFMLKHIQWHHNEVVFVKCQSPTCNHCGKHPVKAKEVFKFLIPKSCAARILSLSRVYQQETSEDQEGGDDDQKDSEDQSQENTDMSDQESSDQGQEDREQGQEDSDQEQEDSDQEQEDSGQDQDMSDQENSENRDERADDDLCVVCGLGEDKNNEEGELWVECTLCLNWTHVYPRKLCSFPLRRRLPMPHVYMWKEEKDFEVNVFIVVDFIFMFVSSCWYRLLC